MPARHQTGGTLLDDTHFFASGYVACNLQNAPVCHACARDLRYRASTSGRGTLWLQGARHLAARGDLTLLDPEDLHDGVPHDAVGYSYRVTGSVS